MLKKEIKLWKTYECPCRLWLPSVLLFFGINLALISPFVKLVYYVLSRSQSEKLIIIIIIIIIPSSASFASVWYIKDVVELEVYNLKEDNKVKHQA